MNVWDQKYGLQVIVVVQVVGRVAGQTIPIKTLMSLISLVKDINHHTIMEVIPHEMCA